MPIHIFAKWSTAREVATSGRWYREKCYIAERVISLSNLVV